MAKERVETYRVSPLDNQAAKLRKVFDYFQYKAPEVDSCLAKTLKSDTDQKAVMRDLLSQAKVKSDRAFLCDRRSYKMGVDDLRMVDFSIPFIYCHKRSKEEPLACLLRHCRNALAHGNVFVKFLKNNTLICLQDFDVDRRTKKQAASALIVVNKASLERWMKRIKECEA